ncbi:MAG: hypothetical protein ACON5H_00325 [Akkermansiaceae bacterium]
MNLRKDVREFIELLNSQKVNYLVVGAHALAWHGLPRYTGDIDFFIATDPENAKAIIQVLQEYGFGDIGLTEEDFLEPDQVIQLGFPPHRIDLLTGISGVSWQEAWKSSVPGTIDDLPVIFIGTDCYLKNKDASGRPQDIADAQRLRDTLHD